jgi:hypothetical protein
VAASTPDVGVQASDAVKRPAMASGGAEVLQNGSSDHSSELVRSTESRSAGVSRRPATIKLAGFDGTAIPLATHLARFENCSSFYGWNSLERMCHLKASLEGSAACLLWELTDSSTEADLITLLWNRFGDRD